MLKYRTVPLPKSQNYKNLIICSGDTADLTLKYRTKYAKNALRMVFYCKDEEGVNIISVVYRPQHTYVTLGHLFGSCHSTYKLFFNLQKHPSVHVTVRLSHFFLSFWHSPYSLIPYFPVSSLFSVPFVSSWQLNYGFSSCAPVKQSPLYPPPGLIMSVVSGAGGISGVTWLAAALRSRSHG